MTLSTHARILVWFAKLWLTERAANVRYWYRSLEMGDETSVLKRACVECGREIEIKVYHGGSYTGGVTGRWSSETRSTGSAMIAATGVAMSTVDGDLELVETFNINGYLIVIKRGSKERDTINPLVTHERKFAVVGMILDPMTYEALKTETISWWDGPEEYSLPCEQISTKLRHQTRRVAR